MAKEVPLSVVVQLETWLKAAKAGNINALAAVVDTPDGVEYAVCGVDIGFDVLGGLDVIMGVVRGRVGHDAG